MKPNLSAFLLFLLFFDQSLSAKAGLLPPKGIPNGFKWPKGNPFKSKWVGDILDAIIQQNLPAQPPNAPPVQIKGLSRIKDYFSNFSYLQSEQIDDYLDQKTESAIKRYQQYFNLQVNGYLTNETLQLISRPRCAVPDMSFDYDFTQNVSWPKAGNRWFQKRNLTYAFLLASQIPDNTTKVFGEAFTQWAHATGFLNFTKATTYDDADIKIGFYNISAVVDYDAFGVSFIREKPPSNVKTGEIHLDGSIYWALPSENDSLSWKDGVLDLESVAMHQIGHLLGLDHSSMNDSVMYPYILPSQQRKVDLSNSDKNNIMNQNANVNSGDGGCLGVLLMTIISLGFTYVLLGYYVSSYVSHLHVCLCRGFVSWV
ncbi:unnamed protein product [Sphenostylis stenocarpa]|uniref:Peptidase metallopeptidase domain-containing protein n=1 Tax=Sphenostylis stenocarpa TaxID=92480 RepID=A0AA86VCG3_9FABA|nr:unnamed protein product [Sphenostylis stenocarpa]